jgi:SpoVK/Ycf46/Vps4 family AAA+-type ATPase
MKQIEKPTINFNHVGGMQKVKSEIDIKIIQPLLNHELFKKYGKKTGGGILMYGPPGCGKTHLARATAGQIKANFISVGIQDVLNMWLGNSEKQLHELFETARRQAPCVMFFDEIDALGASRTDMRQSSSKMLINQFLSELDGVQYSNDGLLILGATNAPWHLDGAFRRPGRFDRIIFVHPPDAEGRESILKILLNEKPTQNIDCKTIAKKTEDFSGADLMAVVDRAIEDILREAIKTGMPKPIETKDLLKHAMDVKPSTKEWFTTARNYALYSNESGQYDDILEYLKIKK